MKKIALGDLGEFWYGDYKEPFEQLEGAVTGHPVGTLLKSDDERLLCAHCGTVHDNLAAHVYWSHKQTAREYKEWAGLLHKSALVSEKVRQSRIRTGLRRNLPNDAAFQAAKVSPTAIDRSYAKGKRNGQWNPERLNKTGRCRLQAIQAGRTVVRETGHLSEKALRHHGIFPATIRAYFGDMDGYRRAVGAAEVKFQRHTREDLIAAMTNLARELGRTPSLSDIRRYGLPTTKVWVRVFGSMADAAKAAGLDPNLPVPDGRDTEVAVMTTYATLGSITRTARHLHMDRSRIEEMFSRYGAPFVTSLGPGFGRDATARREWAADMARRLAGMTDTVAA